MPRMLDKIVSGIQSMPITVMSAVPEAPSPQNRLTMPLARVIQAMTFTRVGFCCMIFLLILIDRRVAPTFLYTPNQKRGCKSIRSSHRFEIFQIHLQRFATVVFV